MGRASVKENKNLYFTVRENLGLTRDKASELLECIPPERIDKIENERALPHPDEVLTMSEKYNAPNLCNYFCSNQCPIGQKYVPEVEMKELSQIVLGALSTLNSINVKKDRLVDITADGIIDDNEVAEFCEILDELDKISLVADTLKLWSEKMLNTGRIDTEKCEKYRKSKKAKKG